MEENQSSRKLIIEENNSTEAELQQVNNASSSDSDDSLIQGGNISPSDVLFSAKSVASSSSQKNSKISKFVMEKFDSHLQDSAATAKGFDDLDAIESVIEVVEEITIPVSVSEELEIIKLFQETCSDDQIDQNSNNEIHETPPTEEKHLLKSKKGPPARLPLFTQTPKYPKGFFKYGNGHYLNFRETNGASNKDNVIKIRDSLQVQDHIVIEPDIDIQTLSDEFQLDFDDSEINSNSNGASMVTATPNELIEKAARETLCCCSCRISLYSRKDVILWESMEFCSEKCLKTYVKVIGSHCNMCNSQVGEHNLGKLCVRFGTVIRQFCASDCEDKFKASHKLCDQCQVNMTDKEKTFCSTSCGDLKSRLENKADFFGRRHCAVCKKYAQITEEVYLSSRSNWLCSKMCRNAFLDANKMTALSCGVCSRGFDINATPRFVSRNMDRGLVTEHASLTWYCSNVCFATQLLRMRKIELCGRCQVKKYNVDMIRKPSGDVVNSKGQVEPEMFFCSIYCYHLHMNPSARELARRKAYEAAQHAVSSATPPPVALPTPPVRLTQLTSNVGVASGLTNPITLQSTARPILVFNQPSSTQVQGFSSSAATPVTNTNHTVLNTPSLVPVEVNHKIVFVPPKPKEMKNKSVWCRPSTFSQNVSADQLDEANVDKSLPTGHSKDEEKRPFYIPIPIPIPVPIYVPVPMAMYNFPVPYPVGLPVFAPVLLPVDSDLFSKMMKTIEESTKNDKMDGNATKDETVKQESAECNATDTMSKDIPKNPNKQHDLADEQTLNDSSNTSSNASDESNLELEVPSCSILLATNVGVSTRKRSHSTSNSLLPKPKRLKDADNSKSSSDSDGSHRTTRSDELVVKGGFQKELGVKAWSDWISRSKRPVSPKIHEMNIKEMNTSLIDFLRNLRKPDGDKYRADVILYFICGLQQAFGLDRRRQNLFMDTALEPFQAELDKELQPFYQSLLKGIRADITMEVTTNLKESHLWTCRQLGVHSPMVLVFTMLYFNTKYFRFYTPEQHRSLAFTNIHKIPKKNVSNGSPGKTATKMFALQFLPTVEQARSPHFQLKIPLEIPQNVDHPSNCPIKHYNFYLSKCPESMKTRKEMFYLLPEVTSTPESPLWYSSQAVPQEILARMLRRVLLIEEVLRNLCTSE